mgnify:CR=1 FL=1
MALRKEKHMYPAVCKWLRNLLRSKYKRAEVHVFDTSNITLSKFLVKIFIIKKEFLRGFADVVSARYSNRNRWGKCRIYLDVLNPNWRLPVQLCHLLQDYLHVPVDTITWGHPNIRDPKLKDYRNGKRHAWAREHQIKIFADDFKQIGFYMEHKQEILEELAEYNEVKGFEKAKYCDPPKEIRKKPRHPEENSDKLPETLRGRHYDSSWQICADLGCWRYNNYIRKQKRLI